MTIELHVGEVDRSIAIMKEVAHWGKNIGRNIWNEQELNRENLLNYYSEDEFYLITVDDEDAAAMIMQWEDRQFWPEFDKNDAGYVHHMSVRRSFSGQGLTGHLINYAVDECKKRKVDKLRLDTAWENVFLRSIYEHNGFELYDKFTLEDQYEFARYEKKV